MNAADYTYGVGVHPSISEDLQHEIHVEMREFTRRLDMFARACHITMVEAGMSILWLKDKAECPEWIKTRLHTIEHGPGQDREKRDDGNAVTGLLVFGLAVLLMMLALLSLSGKAYSSDGRVTVSVECVKGRPVLGLTVKAIDTDQGATVNEMWGSFKAGGNGQNIGRVVPGTPVKFTFDVKPGSYSGGFNMTFDNGKVSSPTWSTVIDPLACAEISTSTSAAPTSTTPTTIVVETSLPTTPPTTTPVTIVPRDCTLDPLPEGCHPIQTTRPTVPIPGTKYGPTTTVVEGSSTATLPATGFELILWISCVAGILLVGGLVLRGCGKRPVQR